MRDRDPREVYADMVRRINELKTNVAKSGMPLAGDAQASREMDHSASLVMIAVEIRRLTEAIERRF